jgi:DNA repair protein RecO (recombination protein O)
MYYKTQGIILRRRDYRENDGLFSIYTRERGKIEAVAKGVKKIKSKMSPHLVYFSSIELMIARGKKFDQIAGATMIKNFSGIKSDLSTIILASFCLEAIDALIKVEHKDERIWKLLNEFLEIFEIKNSKLEKSPPPPLVRGDKGGLARAFSLKLLSYLGYTPEFYNCVVCKNKIVPDGNIFSFKKGGLVCGKCYKTRKIEGLKISTNAIKVLRLMLKEDLKKFMKLRILPGLSGEINKIIDSFLAVHLEKELKSQRLLTLSEVYRSNSSIPLL